MIVVQNAAFEVVKDVKNGFNEEAFKARYSDILNKYDYIVGDWGYSQLRLKGFLTIKIKRPHLIRRSARLMNIFTSTVISDVPTLF